MALSLTYDRRGKMLSVVEGGAISTFLNRPGIPGGSPS
jgi:hypothetical protein